MPKFWDTKKQLILHLDQIENLLLLGVPILKHITVVSFYDGTCICSHLNLQSLTTSVF